MPAVQEGPNLQLPDGQARRQRRGRQPAEESAPTRELQDGLCTRHLPDLLLWHGNTAHRPGIPEEVTAEGRLHHLLPAEDTQEGQGKIDT